MIDWFKGLIGYNAEAIELGKVLILSPGGEVTWSAENWVKAVGSYDEHIRVRRDTRTSAMLEASEKYDLVSNSTVYQIDGNPSKFLQGHNVFGPSVDLLLPVVQAVIYGLPGELRPPDIDDARLPAISRNRVDVTTSVRMDSDQDVHDFIQHAQLETRSRHKRHQAGLTGSTTVSYGVGSERWMLVMYCKRCELEKLSHRPADPVMYNDLLEYARGLLRVELRLYSKELVNRGSLHEGLIWEYFDRLEVGVMKDDADVKAKGLRPPVRLLYEHWLSGHDVSPASGLMKRAAFYKYRKEILEATGQDISLPPVKGESKASREMFGTEWLKAHEVTEVPPELQRYLWKPGDEKLMGDRRIL